MNQTYLQGFDNTAGKTVPVSVSAILIAKVCATVLRHCRQCLLSRFFTNVQPAVNSILSGFTKIPFTDY